MPNISKTLSNNVRALLEHAKISQNKFAESCKIQSGNLSNYLNGIHEPGLDIIEKWADKLNVSVSDLFKADEPPKTNFDSILHGIIILWSGLSEHDKKSVRALVEAMSDSGNESGEATRSQE